MRIKSILYMKTKKKKQIKKTKYVNKNKKELEKLTKEWVQDLSKKNKSKKSINKFINSIKKKCKHSLKKKRK